MGMISLDKRGQGVDLYHSDSSLEIVLLIEIMLGRDLSSLVLETSKDGNLHPPVSSLLCCLRSFRSAEYFCLNWVSISSGCVWDS